MFTLLKQARQLSRRTTVPDSLGPLYKQEFMLRVTCKP